MNLNDLIGPAVLLSLFASALRLGVPIAIASVGECFGEKAGVYNLGLEGMMLIGAATGFIAELQTGSPVFGMILSVFVAAFFGLIVAFIVVDLQVDQIVAGISVTIFGGGLSAFVYHASTAAYGSPSVKGFKILRIPFLEALPGVGVVFFQQTLIVYVGFILIALLVWLLKISTLGLMVKAAGDHPDALNAAGRSVRQIRYLGVIISSAMAGFAGAALVSGVGVFREYMTAGRGWVALSMVILARWDPIIAAVGGLGFGLIDALQLRVQAISGGVESKVPYEFFQALPYIMTFVIVIIATIKFRRSGEPRFLGTPYS